MSIGSRRYFDAGPEYWKFDFNPSANPSGGVAQGRGGEGVLADRSTFPHERFNLLSFPWTTPIIAVD